MCQLPPKNKYWREKAKHFLWRQLSQSQICEIWRQAIWQPWPAEAACTLFFFCWPVSDDNNSSAPEVINPALPTHVVFRWGGRSNFACADRLGSEKLLILLHWFGTLGWLGLTHLCELCTWFTAGCHCCVAKLWDRTCGLLKLQRFYVSAVRISDPAITISEKSLRQVRDYGFNSTHTCPATS